MEKTKVRENGQKQQQINLDELDIIQLYEMMIEQQNELMRIQANLGVLRAAIEKKKKQPVTK